MTPELYALVAFVLGAALGAAAGYALCKLMNRNYMDRMIESASPSNLRDIHRAAAYRDIEQHLSKYSVGVSENAVRKEVVKS